VLLPVKQVCLLVAVLIYKCSWHRLVLVVSLTLRLGFLAVCLFKESLCVLVAVAGLIRQVKWVGMVTTKKIQLKCLT